LWNKRYFPFLRQKPLIFHLSPSFQVNPRFFFCWTFLNLFCISVAELVLVTGGGGLIGKAISSLVGFDNSKYVFLTSKDGDLRDFAQTEAVFEKYQ
jgi:hypothetical protein